MYSRRSDTEDFGAVCVIFGIIGFSMIFGMLMGSTIESRSNRALLLKNNLAYYDSETGEFINTLVQPEPAE